MTTSKSTQATVPKRLVIKLGGSMLEGLSDIFFERLKELQAANCELIIVHGGGPAISQELARHQINADIIDGIRVTTKESASIIRNLILGAVNPLLVHQLNRAGILSIGLSGFDGKLLACHLLNQKKYGYVGEIKTVNRKLIEKLIQIELVPVFSCIGATDEGEPLNINADTVASKVALAVGADSLLLVTDTPGIKIEGVTQSVVSAHHIEKWIETGEIYGGMIPKVQAALNCLQSGIPSVRITDQHLNGTVIEAEEVYS